MKNKRQFLFRAAALLIILAIAALMFVIGRGHTVYIDNKTMEYEGKTVDAFYKVRVNVRGEEVAKLSARDRGMTDVMGQKITMALEITDAKDAAPRSEEITLSIPYGMDGIVVNLPALLAGLPQEACMEEFVVTSAAEEEEEDSDGGGSEDFPMGDI